MIETGSNREGFALRLAKGILLKTQSLIDGYANLFARKRFVRLNRFLYQLALRGLGVLNYQNDVVSGEDHFVRELLRGIAKPVVLDVGANRGDYSLLVLAANPNARILAFEPHPETFRALSKHVVPRGVEVINAACGKASGHMVLYDYLSQGSSHASLYEGVIEEIHHRNAQAINVEVLDLDTFASEHGIEKIDLLKIDTEGHELEVLGGANRLIEEGRIRAIQFEFNEMNVISRTFFRDFYNRLPGYVLHRMLRDGLIPLPEYSSALCEIFAFQNIAAILRDRSA